jgi:DNA repair exonuclease SbcCD ATPase subunit
MINQDLDKKILKLTKEHRELSSAYDQVCEEIEELEYRQESLESRMDGIEEEIKDLKERMLITKIQQLDIKTDDPFLKDFITASYFCIRSDESTRPILCNVNITENELQACDGYRAIIIRNSDIPISLKNTKVKWDVRDNFEQHINSEDGEYMNLKSAYPVKDKLTFKLEDLSTDDFYEKLNVEDGDTCKRIIIQKNITPEQTEKLFVD